MNEPLRHYMQVGIVHFVVYPCLRGDGPILDTVRRICADPYFDAIEISWVQDPVVRGKVKEMLQVSGINFSYCAHPWLLLREMDLNAEDAGHRLQAVDTVRQAIDDAAFFGAGKVALLSGAYPGPAGKAAALDRLLDSLERICEYGQARNMQILLEVFDQNFDKKRLIGRAEDAAAIASRVRRGWDNFGIMADLSHLPMLGETPQEALEPIAAYLRHAHIGNCCTDDRSDPAWGDSHPRFGYPGGRVDVAEIAEYLQTLFDVGYLRRQPGERPVVSFEIKPVGNEDPELVIANAKRKLAAAWAKLKLA